ncbi:hypothetical protein [Spiroplasma endosymbiont of Glossina fuscipes fuscipes]|uniref:hypothetical protein n=1 Tax=Spiroplasma endosymbiont of Glossina fuscipes fuscipes TaxID=2004463 RepID=UPI003C792163
MNITESIKFNKLQEENEKLKKELAKKDKEHKKQFKRMYDQFQQDKEFEINQYKFETKQHQLFKEDFYLLCEEDGITYDWESLQTDEITIEMHLEYCESNNHKYCLIKDINDLPSKLESKVEE